MPLAVKLNAPRGCCSQSILIGSSRETGTEAGCCRGPGRQGLLLFSTARQTRLRLSGIDHKIREIGFGLWGWLTIIMRYWCPVITFLRRKAINALVGLSCHRRTDGPVT